MIFYEEPIKIELRGTELYVNGQKHHEHNIRKLQKMKEVLLDHVDAESEEDFNIYHMYRAVHSNIEMRYDITLIPRRMLGREFNKTYGHYHPKSKAGVEYPEIYQVLRGEAIFVLQRKNHDGSVNAIVIDAKERDIVVFPPGYGHVSINPSIERDLILANIVFNSFESDYEEYALNKGAAFYFTENGLEQNTNYLVRGFERINAKELTKRYGFECKDLLVDFVKNPDKFQFLEKPELLFKGPEHK